MSSGLLAVSDWRQLYQTFKGANFQSYDFDTIRKSMIDYLRLYYPENFNDYIESSEYVALIDLIAFLGQSLAYRTDLNARENFIDTAERRDSILKLARLISYSPKRSTSASGIMKITSISTTESIIDSNGLNLANIPISWDDVTNDNWLDQYTTIMNAVLIPSQTIGRPGNTQVIAGVSTSEYSINLSPVTLPAFSYNATIENNTKQFEIVNATTVGKSYVYEVAPRPTSIFNLLYRNDNNGNGSNNTGFFAFFKQGKLSSTTFTLSDSQPNKIVPINVPNINNTDVWLYQLDSAGNVVTVWTQVPVVTGANIIYNNEQDRNLFQVVTQSNDTVNLVFGDGSFANIPHGTFTVYYRTSSNSTYKITPDEMQGTSVNIDYTSRTGRVETLTIVVDLHYTVSNATERETIESIRQRAPEQYYTQNRMITGEDYNLFPYAAFPNILKVKAINRTSSGINRSLDVMDPTGKYSSTIIFSDDGAIYKDVASKQRKINFTSYASAFQAIYTDINDIMSSVELKQFYLSEQPRIDMSTVPTTWVLASVLANESTGIFNDDSAAPVIVGAASNSILQYIRKGSIIKFTPPTGSYFDIHHDLTTTTGQTELYATVIDVQGVGISDLAGGLYSDGSGAVILSTKIPQHAIVSEIIPSFKDNITPDELSQSSFAQSIADRSNFGLAYDAAYQTWVLADGSLDMNAPYPANNWLISLIYDGVDYNIRYRNINYVFESLSKVKFYFNEDLKVYDSNTGQTIYDQIKILRTNTGVNTQTLLITDLDWYVHKNVTEADGYEADNKILITYPGLDTTGIIDDPDLFLKFAGDQYVFHDVATASLIPSSKFVTSLTSEAAINAAAAQYADGQLFYITSNNTFFTLTGGLAVDSTDLYIAVNGRDDIMFKYRHNSPNNYRIDPSPSNIVDLYILTALYDSEYRLWIQDTTNSIIEPMPPSTDELHSSYSDLQNYKPISDSIIYNSVKFKPLFGAKASPSLQAILKVVKSNTSLASDNDVKTSVISQITAYFDAGTLNPGDAFFFSDLSTYIHNNLGNMISSIIITSKVGDPFGSLFQVNAEPYELLVSAATVDDIEIISAVTLANLS